MMSISSHRLHVTHACLTGCKHTTGVGFGAHGLGVSDAGILTRAPAHPALVHSKVIDELIVLLYALLADVTSAALA